MLDRDDLELYDVEVEVAFVERLRGMVAFDSVEELVAQMNDDVGRARELLAAVSVDAAGDAARRRRDLVPRARAALLRRRGAGRRPPPALRPRRIVPLLAGRRCWSRPPPAVAAGDARRRVELVRPAVGCWRSSGWSRCWYALTALRCATDRGLGARAGPSAASRLLFPLATRALPLLLLFVTFLFINTEVWQVDLATSTAGCCGWPCCSSALAAVGFLLVRLPEEVDRFDDDVDAELLLDVDRRARRSSEAARELVDDPDADPAA